MSGIALILAGFLFGIGTGVAIVAIIIGAWMIWGYKPSWRKRSDPE